MKHGDEVKLNKDEMRARNRRRFLGYHGDITATVLEPRSEHAEHDDGLWLVELDESGTRITVQYGAMEVIE